MAVLLSCPQGHRWESLEGKGPDTCPICGAVPLTLDQSQVVGERLTVPPGPSTSSVVGLEDAKPSLPEQFGRYRIIKSLGKGGMGSVYLAHDTQLDRRVALKVPHFRPEVGSQVLARFYREARAAGTIQHAHICPVYDVGEINGTHYLTMAYIEGKPLTNFIDPAKLPTARQVAALVRKLALALAKAHEGGIIHRDLKPSNIMINKSGEPVIMDFGLARRDKQDERLTQTGMMLGTPSYMPPEQVSGDVDAMGPAGDIYSLGVIMYQLLTGLLPFEGKRWAVLGQIMVDEAPPPSRHRVDVDAVLESICMKAMAKQIKDRYASMGALAEALTDYLKNKSQVPEAMSEPPTAAPPSPNTTEERHEPSSGASSEDQISLFAGKESSTVTEGYLRAMHRARRKKRLVLGALFGGLLHTAAIIGLVIYFWPKEENSTNPETGTHKFQVAKKGSEASPPNITSSQKTGKATLEASRDKKPSKPPATEFTDFSEGLLPYVPADCNVVLGLDLRTLSTHPVVANLKKLQGPDLLKNFGPDAGLNFSDFDYCVLGLKQKTGPGSSRKLPFDHVTMVFKRKGPLNLGKLLKAFQAGPAQPMNGKTYYELPGATPESPRLLYQPADGLLVLSSLPKDRLGWILGPQEAQPIMAPESMALVRRLIKSPAWMVLKPELLPVLKLEAKTTLNKADAQGQEIWKPSIEALGRANEIWLSAQVHSNDIQLSVGLIYHHAVEAKQAAGMIQDFWQLRGKALAKRYIAEQPLNDQPLYWEIVQSLNIDSPDQMARVSAQLSLQSLETVVKSLNGKSTGKQPDRVVRPSRPDAEGQAILDKAITAHGGLANLAKFPAEMWKFQGVLNTGGRLASITGEWAYELTDKARVVIKARNGVRIVTRIEILNGDAGWIKENGITRAMNTEELAEAKEDAYANSFSWLFPFKETTFTLSPLGEVQVEGRPAVGVRVSCNGHRDANLFFDKESVLLVKVERLVKDVQSRQEVNQEVFASEYKEIEGILYPMKMKIMRDGKLHLEVKISEFKRKEKLDDRQFARP